MVSKKIVVIATIGKSDKFTCDEDQHRCIHGDCGTEEKCSEMQHIFIGVEGEEEYQIKYICVDCREVVEGRIDDVFDSIVKMHSPTENSA